MIRVADLADDATLELRLDRALALAVTAGDLEAAGLALDRGASIDAKHAVRPLE